MLSENIEYSKFARGHKRSFEHYHNYYDSSYFYKIFEFYRNFINDFLIMKVCAQ